MAYGEKYFAQWRDHDNNVEVVTSAGTVGGTPPALTASEGSFTLAFGGSGLNVGRVINFGDIKNAYNGMVVNVHFRMSGAIASTIDFQVGTANQITGSTSNSNGEYTIECTFNSGYTSPEFTIYSTDAAQASVLFSALWIQGSLHEIKLLEKDYVSSTTEIEKKATVPYIVTRRGDKNVQIDRHILGSEIQFNYLSTVADIAGFDAMFESNFKDWKVVHYFNNTVDWSGWLLPENYSRQWIPEGNYYTISLSASDGLARLKEIEYTDFSTGDQFTDRVSIITAIKRALEHLELELDFRVQLGTTCTTGALMTSTECSLDKVTHDSARFTKTEDGREINESCYLIIEKLLAPFNCYLIQADGLYWIVNAQEIDSFYFPITWTALTVGSRTANDLSVSLADYKYRTDSEVQKIRPLEKVNLTFRDRNIQDTLITNGDFAGGSVAGWTADPQIDTFTANLYLGNYELQVNFGDAIGTIPTTPPYFYQTAAEAIVVRGTEDQVIVTFRLRCEDITMDGGWSGQQSDETVRVKPQLRKTTIGGTIISATNSGPRSVGNDDSFYTTYTFLFPVSVDDDYFLEFIIDKAAANWSDYDSIDVRFDDIYMAVIYSDGSDVTFDKFYGINNTSSIFTDIIDGDLFFGDSVQDNDIGSFQISDTRTDAWDRFGKTEDGTLQVLFGQNIIENFGKYKDYVRVTIFDPKHNIDSFSLLTVDSKDYQIITVTEIYGGGARRELQCELVEVLNDAVNTSITSQSLTSIDGESTQSVAAASSGSGGGAIDDNSTSTSTTWSSSKILTGTTLQTVTDNGATTTNQISITTTATALRVLDGVADGVVFKADANGGHVIGYDGSAYNELVLRTAASLSNGITILANGDVGLNDSTPTFKLDVNGTGRFVQDLTTDADMTADSFATTNVDIETGGSYIIDATGTISATDFRGTSDITKKKDLIKITGALEVIDKLNGYYFTWKDTDKKDLGLIAQMVKPVLPQTVSIDEAGKHSLNYNSFIALLIEGVKEVHDLVIRLFKQLNRRIDKLEQEIEKK